MSKVLLIVEKEFDEIMKNRMILATILLFPLLFSIVIPLAMFIPVIVAPEELDSSANETTRMIGLIPGVEGMSAQEAMIIFMTTATLPFFMMLPAMLPTIISSYSVIGEKKNRTLEPLLAAPVSVEDIMIGKTISALVPALAATWISAVVYAALVWLITHDIVHRVLIPNLVWMIGLVVLAPLLAFLGVMLTVVISSRVNDPRTAQQISIIFVLPLIALFIGQMSGIFLINTSIMLIVCVIALIADIAIVKIGSDLFDREEILTRWK